MAVNPEIVERRTRAAGPRRALPEPGGARRASPISFSRPSM
jgi:hypothetical protein